MASTFLWSNLMNTETDEAFTLDAAAVEAFSAILNDEGHMRAGFVIHESNNNNVSLEDKAIAQ